MKKILATIFFSLFTLCGFASDYYATTDVLYLDYGPSILTETNSGTLSLTVKAMMGTNAFNLSGMFVRWTWCDLLGNEVISYDGYVLDATGGLSIVTSGYSGNFSGSALLKAYTLASNYVGLLSKDYISISIPSSSSASCGDVYVTVNPTADVHVTTGPVTVSATSSVNVSIASGLASLAGATGTVHITSTNSSVQVTVSTNVDGSYDLDFCVFGDVAAHTPVPNIGSNKASFTFSGSTNYWQVPVGVTSIYALVWAGAGAGSAYGGAGFSEGRIPVTPLEYLGIVVGQGGQSVTGYLSQSDNAWPNGGRGVCGTAAASGWACGGGGRSGVYRETNELLIAGASGGGFGNEYTGGGGLGGFSPGTIAAGRGQGASQTNGGEKGASTIAAAFTNSAGAYNRGGDAGCSTNNNSTVFAGGGGDGHFGGGGGYSEASHGNVSGGAGSGFVNVNLGVIGFTVASRGVYPSGADRPEYADVSEAGKSSQPAVSGNRANPGYVVIYY